MATLCSTRDVLDEAGFGASTDVTGSSSWLTRIIERNEKAIVAMTRRDWVNSYASVDANVKELLKRVCAKMSALDVVSYDTRGFGNNATAEAKLDVLQDGWTTGLKDLKDFDTTKIREVS